MDSPNTDWQLLILAFQSGQDSTRVRLWRALKALGAATLRDGVYLLPNRSDLRDALLDLAESARAAGNQAYHLPVAANAEEQAHYRSLFDREAEYRTLQSNAETLLGQLPGLSEAELLKRLRQIHREAEQLRRTDYFPGSGRGSLEAQLARLESAAQATLSPDEPSPAPDTGIDRLDPADYRGRLWATRAAMWVDRVASAWLIREFIDPEARFVWLDTPAECPAEALGFDFDGAAFTHVGDRVTFEVLLAAFTLEHDSGLAGLAEMVHFLDVGGRPIPEAPGFESILTGAKQQCADDDALLARVTPVLHDLRQAYEQQSGGASR
ncbi:MULTISPECIES: chromate resistance protein ChrB domain-containing protein [unclassified Thioalkalivibrio]|uniref:chromate resistance protein ChrB domain-containing protein n=1 Tax=unclassified Thioalkalivibrio TaxID=2621013 RepID=UPI000376E8B3|nr:MULTISPECIES: chromate resistance protein ChrB domain-containing protein [unclassified Thioalkalivibrio]